MGFLAHLWVTISLFFTSIFGGIFGLSNTSPPPVASTEQTSDSTQVAQTPTATTKTNGQIVADQASVATTPILDSQGKPTAYARDKTHVYYFDSNFGDAMNAEVLAEADRTTFVPVLSIRDRQEAGSFIASYAKDKNHVYVKDQIIPEADPLTFVPIFSSTGTNSGYTKDKNHVYYCGSHCSMWILGTTAITAIPDADPATFKDVGTNFGLDSKNVYYFGKKLANADPPTFKVLCGTAESIYGVSCGFAKDKNNVWAIPDYIGGIVVISGADAATIIISQGGDTGTDKYRAYDNQGQVVITVDKASFALIPNSSYGKDKFNVFWIPGDVPVRGTDPNTFITFPTHTTTESYIDFAKDKNHVYCNDKVLEGADVSTFHVSDSGQGQDKNRTYNSCQVDPSVP